MITQNRRRKLLIGMVKNRQHGPALGGGIDKALLYVVIKPQRKQQLSPGMILSLCLFRRALACQWGLRFARLALAYLRLKCVDLFLEFGDVGAFPLLTALLVAPDTGEVFILPPGETMMYDGEG